MFTARITLLFLAAIGWSFVFRAHAADSDGLQASVAPDPSSDGAPHISPPDLRPTPLPVSADAGVPTEPLPRVVADAPSGSEASLAAEPVHAPDLPPKTDTGESVPAPPSPNATMNLINLMVKRGLLTKEDAQGLMQQAQQEAAQAQAAQQSQPAPAAPAASPAVPADDNDVQVNYVPDVVKNQIRDDVTASVMKQARDEHWDTNSNVPDWVHRFHVLGDIRLRTEGDYFPAGNDNTGAFTNFNSINTGSPFDTSAISNPRFPPEYDVDQTRYRLRLRARVGADIDLGDNFTAGMRVGTGQDNSPTTQNQTLGLANNGQGGDFSKYAVWLDRAFIRYDFGDSSHNFSLLAGRFDNPFLSSSMIWASEIGFDGLAFVGNYKVNDVFTPFFTAGFFPVFNTDFNFASDQPAKFASEDKYLYAAQAGTTLQITKDISTKSGAAVYYYQNIEGKLSDPFVPLSAADQGDTDDSRPSFAQNGNTYMEIRDIEPVAANDFGTIDQYQYYGLATPFHEVALTSQIDFSRFDPFHIQLLGEYVNNLAFDQNAINAIAVNNRGSGGAGTFAGGNQGFNLRLTLGQPLLQKKGDWNIVLTYRYVESDATVDAFTDADFGGPLVGTNLQGYIIGAYYAITPRVNTSLRFMSADSIAGPTYHNDLFQFDINAKF